MKAGFIPPLASADGEIIARLGLCDPQLQGRIWCIAVLPDPEAEALAGDFPSMYVLCLGQRQIGHGIVALHYPHARQRQGAVVLVPKLTSFVCFEPPAEAVRDQELGL